MKECTRCKQTKKLEEFYKTSPKYGGKPRSACKECYIEWRNTTGRNKQYKRRYGITIEDYNTIFNSQNGKCSICKKHQSEFKTALAVDHCHKSNEIRGLLCYNCNSGLGRFQDNVDNLTEAISYLLRFKDKQDTILSCPQ